MFPPLPAILKPLAAAALAWHLATVIAAPAEPAPAQPVIAMQHTSWTASDGAPTGITAIAQTPDGWLWIGGAAGLFRFDGARFERARDIGLEPLSSSITNLGVLPDGTLWIVYKYGGASLVANGRMRHFRVGEHGTPAGSASGLAQDGAGRLWLGTSGGGLREMSAEGVWRKPAAAMAAPGGAVHAMLRDRAGAFWVRTGEGVFSLPKGASRFERQLDVTGNGILAEHPDGSVWTSDLMRPGLRLLAGAPGADQKAWQIDDRINVFLFDRAGNLWQPDYGGVLRHSAAGQARQHRTDAEHGLSGLHGFTVFQDREDNIWVGTENGLDRFREARLKPIDLPRYTAGARALAPRPDGGAWVDRSSLAGPAEVPVPFAPPSSNLDLTTALHAAADGTLWSGGIGGLWKVRDGQREAVPLPAGLVDPQHTAIFSLATDGGGALWASMGRRGLYTLRDGRWSAHGGVTGLAGFAATAMTAGPRGRMWFGSTDDQLALLERLDADAPVRRFGRADGLRIGTVLAILPVADGAWIGGENGLAWFDGHRFAPVTGQGGEPFTGITGLVFARDGTLWMNGGAGLSAIAPEELRRAAADPAHPVRFERLDYRDGLVGTASAITPLPSAIRAKDGTLWFSTMASVFAFDPARLPRNALVPPVYVTKLKAGGKAWPARQDVQLPPHTSALEVEFTALSYRAAERMGFRYQLDGVDHGWQEAQGRRAAQYTNLAPGRYRFRVIASNDDGVWNEEGAALSFEIAPSLTQTLWFRILCALGAALALWLLHRMRLRHVARGLAARMDERHAERERIARELHDTLLQSIQGLILKMTAAVHRLRDGEREPLEAALDQANRVLAEGRDRVAGLRGEVLPAGGLAQAISSQGELLAREHGVRFSVVTEGAALPLEDAVTQEALAIVREAVWNACAHAQPRTVSVTLCYAPAGLSIAVVDDGRGMPRAIVDEGGRAGHWGIPGMRERAARVGATLALATSAQGTVWTLRIPCLPAPKSRG
jgi:signal transduction histidine kinase/ligand-binding sensor domain-containing protein